MTTRLKSKFWISGKISARPAGSERLTDDLEGMAAVLKAELFDNTDRLRVAETALKAAHDALPRDHGNRQLGENIVLRLTSDPKTITARSAADTAGDYVWNIKYSGDQLILHSPNGGQNAQPGFEGIQRALEPLFAERDAQRAAKTKIGTDWDGYPAPT